VKNNSLTGFAAKTYSLTLEVVVHRSSELGNQKWIDRLHDDHVTTFLEMSFNGINVIKIDLNC